MHIMSRRSQTRQQRIKAASDSVYLAQQAKQKRIETATKISKSKRSEIIGTYRHMNSNTHGPTRDGYLDDDAESYTESASELLTTDVVSSLPSLTNDLFSNHYCLQRSAVQKIGNVFLTDFEAIPQSLLGRIIPQYVGFLKHKEVSIQLQALRGIANLISNPKARSHANAIIECGLISALMAISRVRQCEQFTDAIILLGTIANQSKDWAKRIARCSPDYQVGGADAIEGTRAVAWMISKICQHKPVWNQITPAFPLLSRLLHSEDEETVIHTCWALYMISGLYEKSERSGIQSIIEHGVTKRIVELTAHESLAIQTAALHVVANISSGNELHVCALIICHVGAYLENCFSSSNPIVARLACTIMSNILAHQRATGPMFQHSDMPGFLRLVENSDNQTQLEVCRGIFNLGITGTREQNICCAIDPAVTRLYNTLQSQTALLLLSRTDKNTPFHEDVLPKHVFDRIFENLKNDPVRTAIFKLKQTSSA